MPFRDSKAFLTLFLIFISGTALAQEAPTHDTPVTFVSAGVNSTNAGSSTTPNAMVRLGADAPMGSTNFPVYGRATADAELDPATGNAGIAIHARGGFNAASSDPSTGRPGGLMLGLEPFDYSMHSNTSQGALNFAEWMPSIGLYYGGYDRSRTQGFTIGPRFGAAIGNLGQTTNFAVGGRLNMEFSQDGQYAVSPEAFRLYADVMAINQGASGGGEGAKYLALVGAEAQNVTALHLNVGLEGQILMDEMDNKASNDPTHIEKNDTRVTLAIGRALW